MFAHSYPLPINLCTEIVILIQLFLWRLLIIKVLFINIDYLNYNIWQYKDVTKESIALIDIIVLEKGFFL